MPTEHIDHLRPIFEAAVSAHERFASSGLDAVAAAADAMGRAVLTGRKVLAFGNGGSASDAQHLVAELVGRFEGERQPLAALALTADSNVVTAITNDYGYASVFTRQVEALGAPGDVAFGISTSGRSQNVEAALATARARGLLTIALTGQNGGKMGAEADIHVNVPEMSTARIQEVHRTIIHGICSLIERQIRAT
jgi:D-sedoheptulose 7-phosphate isomerase